MSLTPPPEAPLEEFHTTSLVIVAPEPSRCVPPQPRTLGDDAGKSAWASPSVTPSPEPLSPDAQQTVTPRLAASWHAVLSDCIPWVVQRDSALPQLMEMTDGLLTRSWTAVLTAGPGDFGADVLGDCAVRKG